VSISIISLLNNFPAIRLAAILIKGIPNALAKKGIVLDALGFASNIYISLF